MVSILTPAEAGVQLLSKSSMQPFIGHGFNPHPRRGGGATRGVLAPALRKRGFNPHPRRGGGATRPPRCYAYSVRCFNPHPRRGGGATPAPSRDSRGRIGFNPHPRRGGGATKTYHPIYVAFEEFQSSPPPRRGCNRAFAKAIDALSKVSILTPAEAGVQRPTRPYARRMGAGVSILTPAEAGVQRRKAPPAARGHEVSILTPAEAGVQPNLLRHQDRPRRPFQSSPPPRRGCNLTQTHSAAVGVVSILTPAEAGVQPALGEAAGIAFAEVSILTPAEAGVQPHRSKPVKHPRTCFNPHPRRGGGATCAASVALSNGRSVFQSSPPPRRGCNWHQPRKPDQLRLRFNPHPRRGGGATQLPAHHPVLGVEFQSSPPPRRGCNRMPAGTARRCGSCFNPHPRRGGGATSRAPAAPPTSSSVSILTPAEAGVQPQCLRARPPPRRFNPHPRRGGGATTAISFNPHPRRGGGATSKAPPAARRHKVSILTPAEAGVQPAAGFTITAGSSFQSSPPPRRGCNMRNAALTPFKGTFQSSPPPRRGCNTAGRLRRDRLVVSILTPAEAGVQR